MRSLFLSIYSGIVCSILAVVFGVYFSLQHINKVRYQDYLADVTQLTSTLVAKGINRQNEANKDRWLDLVATLMDVNITTTTREQGFRQAGLSAIGADEYTLTSPVEGEQAIQISITLSGLTEKLLSATAFLALNELGHYPVEQRQAVFEQLQQQASFPVERLARQHLSLSTKQLRRLDRGETVLVRSESMGQQEWIVAYAPWGNTQDVLAIGPIPFFEAYPIELLLSAMVLCLILIAAIVFLFIDHLRKRVQQIQLRVDAIGPSHEPDADQHTGGDTITELNDKINNMAGRIERLLNEQAYMIRAISHDLRTPIAKLQFRLETIGMMLGEDQQLVDKCREDIDSLDRLIDELLTYERLSTKPDLHFAEVDLGPLLQREIADTEVVFSDIAFRLSGDDSHSMLLLGNQTLLIRLFSNLLVNAAKFAQSRVDIKVTSVAGRWCINIIDDGPGFGDEDIQSLFKPFYKADKARTTGKGGYGLGLAIAKQIARQHGGDLSAANGDAGGAVFSIQLPAVDSRPGASMTAGPATVAASVVD